MRSLKRIVMRIITIVEPYFTLDTRTTYNREFDPSKVKTSEFI